MSESQNRKPYTLQTWPGYKWIRSKTIDGPIGPFELGGPCAEGVFEKEVKILWRFREITVDGCECSHDGVTWFPCYEGGEASAVPAERVPTPDDATFVSTADLSEHAFDVTERDAAKVRQQAAEQKWRVSTPDDARRAKILRALCESDLVERMAGELSDLATENDSLTAQLSHAQNMHATEVQRSRTMADDLTAVIESLKAERDRLQSELAESKVESEKRNDVIRRQTELFVQQSRELADDAAAKARGVTFEDGPVERAASFTDIIREQLANDPELAAEVEAARVEMENDALECPKCRNGHAGVDCTGEAIDCHYCDGNGRITAEMYVDLKDRCDEQAGDLMCHEARERMQPETDDVPASVLDAARKAWRLFKWLDVGKPTESWAFGADFSVDGAEFHLKLRRMRFTDRAEDHTDAAVSSLLNPPADIPDDFLKAMEWAANNGQEADEVEPRTDSSGRDDTVPRFTLTPDGCGVLDRERPGMVVDLGNDIVASLLEYQLNNGERLANDFYWAPYTPPAAAAPETVDVFIPELAGVQVVFWRCPNHPEGQVKWNATKTVATCQQCYRTNLDDKATEHEQPNQEHADGQQVGGSGDERREDRSANVDDGQAECEPCVQRLENVVEQPTGNIPPSPHPGDVTPPLVIEVGGRYACSHPDWTCEVIGRVNSNGGDEFWGLFRNRNQPEIHCAIIDGDGIQQFAINGDQDLIRRLPDVVTVEVDPEIVAKLKERGYRPVAYRLVFTGEQHYGMFTGNIVTHRPSRPEDAKFALIVEPIPAADTTALLASDAQKGGE